jgi:hypothetical protein
MAGNCLWTWRRLFTTKYVLVLLCQIDLFDFFQDTYPAASCGVVYLSA